MLVLAFAGLNSIQLALVLGVLTLLLATLALVQHRVVRRMTAEALEALGDAKSKGSHKAQLQYPWIDLTRCIGCGLCVPACPEEQVIEIIHGQAQVVHGARCVGHGRCAEVCPVLAMEVTIEDFENRRDIPALTDDRESVSSPGLFLAGEITGFALVKTAVTHGKEVAQKIASRLEEQPNPDSDGYDLVIIGGGPAGLSCALESKRLGVKAVILEQESVGGTVAKYPRRKLVMTQPVELPLYGLLDRTEIMKEDLIGIWEDVIEKSGVEVRSGVRFDGLESREGGGYTIKSSADDLAAPFVCLAIGRRGSPRKLGVPGEDLPKVTYSLVDARSYNDRKIIVVGGGDSAIEAAVGLAEQEGNKVTVSYRKASFFRMKPKNERRLQELVKKGTIQLAMQSQIEGIDEGSVFLKVASGDQESQVRLANDDVFVFAGGIPPFKMLESAGISFKPEDRPPMVPLVEKGTGLLLALAGVAAFLFVTIIWWAIHLDYYGIPPVDRLASPSHAFLRSAGPFGLSMGVLAILAMLWNLAYLARRAGWGNRIPGSLTFWMSSHVFTGMLSLVAVFVHAAGAPRLGPGGYAFGLMAVVVIAGAIGRYLYSFVPRAANGRELALDEARVELLGALDSWEAPPESRLDLRAVKSDLLKWMEGDRWVGGFFSRLYCLLTAGSRAKQWFRERESAGLLAGLEPAAQRQFLRRLARAHRAAFAASHWEDLRAIMSTWRYIHRWLAALLVLVVILHIVIAFDYGNIFGSSR